MRAHSAKLRRTQLASAPWHAARIRSSWWLRVRPTICRLHALLRWLRFAADTCTQTLRSVLAILNLPRRGCHDEAVAFWACLAGSYDEKLRLWDVRQILAILRPVACRPAAPTRSPVRCKEHVARRTEPCGAPELQVRNLVQPQQSAAVPCGGGVWRICWHPVERTTMLCACMQNGFAVVRDGQVRPCGFSSADQQNNCSCVHTSGCAIGGARREAASHCTLFCRLLCTFAAAPRKASTARWATARSG